MEACLRQLLRLLDDTGTIKYHSTMHTSACSMQPQPKPHLRLALQQAVLQVQDGRTHLQAHTHQ